MPSLRNGTIFLCCTCLNVRWPERRLRTRQEATARFLQPAPTWKVTFNSAGLSKREGEKGAKASNGWASRTLALSRRAPLQAGGAGADSSAALVKSLMSSNKKRWNPGDRMV